MGFLAIYAEIQKRFRTSWAGTTPVEWPNELFMVPFPQSPWSRFSIPGCYSRQINIGQPAVIRLAGIIYIQIFTKQSRGTEASALAEKVRLIFNNWHSDVVHCSYARVKHVGVDRQGWYQVNVAIPFRSDEEFD